MRALPDITVRRALELPALREGLPEVVAGHAGLDAPVRWVHTGEADSIPGTLTGGEVLLTTGMGLGRRAAEQRAYVEEMADRGAAALVVELGSVFPELPGPLVEAAERRGLPLIALRNPIAFLTVTEAVHTEILSARHALLRRGEQIQRELTDLMLDGEGIPAVLAALAETLHAAIFLDDPGGRLLSHALPPGAEGDPLDLWEVARRPGSAPGVASAPVRMGSRHADGRLLVAGLRAPYDALAEVALDRAAGIVALALLRARQEEELSARERGSLLVNLADGRIAPAAVGRALLAAGLERVPALLLPVAAVAGAGGVGSGAAGAGGAGSGAAGAGTAGADAADAGGVGAIASGDWEGALREAQRTLERRGLPAVVGRRARTTTLLAVVALREAEQRGAAAEAVAEALRDALANVLGSHEATVAVGRANELETAGAELRLSEESAAAASGLPARPWHDVATLELRRLLWRRRDDADQAAFAARVLGPLLAHDDQRRHVLLPTLEALLANGGRKTETARALHLNRQTLYHRLQRIEQLLGVDLGDSEQLLTLHVALLARRVSDETPPRAG